MIDFNKLIEQHLSREVRPKRIGNYYPSEIGSCLRRVWYSYKFPVAPQMDMLKIFEVGNIMHHFVAEVLRSEKIKDVKLIEAELPFKLEVPGFTISGRVDDVMILLASGEKFLVEVKSIKDLRFAEKPHEQHVMQLQLYMHATKIHKGAIVYIEKGTLLCKTFPVDYDECAAALALARFKKLHESLKNDKIPEPEARQNSETEWQCKRCDWREKCAGEKS